MSLDVVFFYSFTLATILSIALSRYPPTGHHFHYINRAFATQHSLIPSFHTSIPELWPVEQEDEGIEEGIPMIVAGEVLVEEVEVEEVVPGLHHDSSPSRKP